MSLTSDPAESRLTSAHLQLGLNLISRRNPKHFIQSKHVLLDYDRSFHISPPSVFNVFSQNPEQKKLRLESVYLLKVKENY